MEYKTFLSLADVSFPRKKPLVIAHRGASREAPENTLSAFQRALDIGVDGIELDVLLTSDKVPIITHNDDLSILTHFQGHAHATPFEVLRSLDAGSHFSTATAGQTMPTLAEALELIARYDITTIVEIKPQRGMKADAAELIGGMISDIKMRGRVIISSFSRQIISELKRRHPAIARALILKNKPFPFFTAAFFAKHKQLSGMHVSIKALTQNFAEKIRSLGCELFAWTANDEARIDQCILLGVDGIITDDPAFAKQYLKNTLGNRGN